MYQDIMVTHFLSSFILAIEYLLKISKKKREHTIKGFRIPSQWIANETKNKNVVT